MVLPGKQRLLWLGVLSLTCALTPAGDQVQFKGSTSVELPKPKRPMDDPRRIRTEPDRPNLEGGFVAPPSINTPLNSRKMREELDKKKNWIFANPYEQQFDSKTEEFMQGEKASGLYSNKWMGETEEKTAVQKFMEEKDSKPGSRENNRAERGDRPDRGDRANQEKFSNRDSDRDELDDPRNELEKGRNDDLFGAGSKNELGRGSLFRSDASVADPFKPLDKAFERNPVTESPFAAKQSAAEAMQKEDLKQQQIAHEREFDQIIQNRLGGSGPASPAVSIGRLDGLNVSSGLGTLDLKSDGSRPGALGGARLGGSGSSGVTFTDGGPSISARSSFDGRSSFDSPIGAISRPAPSFAPPAAPELSGSRPAFTPAPFSLPFPQRKF